MESRKHDRGAFEHIEAHLQIKVSNTVIDGKLVDFSVSGAGIMVDAMPRCEIGTNIEVLKAGQSFSAIVKRVACATTVSSSASSLSERTRLDATRRTRIEALLRELIELQLTEAMLRHMVYDEGSLSSNHFHMKRNDQQLMNEVPTNKLLGLPPNLFGGISLVAAMLAIASWPLMTVFGMMMTYLAMLLALVAIVSGLLGLAGGFYNKKWLAFATATMGISLASAGVYFVVKSLLVF